MWILIFNMKKITSNPKQQATISSLFLIYKRRYSHRRYGDNIGFAAFHDRFWAEHL